MNEKELERWYKLHKNSPHIRKFINKCNEIFDKIISGDNFKSFIKIK